MILELYIIDFKSLKNSKIENNAVLYYLL